LKVKRGPADPASLIVPRYVWKHGMTQAVAPLASRDAALSALLPFTLIVYPFIEARMPCRHQTDGAPWIE
jgi:hypothetical protein